MFLSSAAVDFSPSLAGSPSLESNLSHQRKKHRDCGAFVGGEGEI